MRRSLVLLVVLVVVFSGSVTAPRSADATVPGAIGRIVFSSSRDDSYGELYTRDFAGGPWTRLTSNTATDLDAAWSPDGSQIAYSSDDSGSWEVWVMDAEGGDKQSLTNEPRINRYPAWSPDGSQIAFTSSGSASDIWVMDADGSNKVNLTPPASAGRDSRPDWSPDGFSIAFMSDRDGWPDIFVMGPDGRGARNLTASPKSSDLDPAWSPDGAQIAFVSDRAAIGMGFDVYVMDADGSEVHRITLTSKVQSMVGWSPDGRHIAFSSPADGDWDLWMVNPDGTGHGHPTNDPKNEIDGSWESVNRSPSAMDDGPRYVRTGGTLHGMSVLGNDSDPDGEPLTAKLVSSPSRAASFLLNPDGTFVYVHDGSAVMSDSFTYAAKDPRGGVSNTATVTVLVGPSDTVGLVDPGSGMWRLRNSTGVVTQFFFGNPGDYPFVGDWNCDGVDTPGLYRRSDGFAYLRNSNTQGTADVAFFFGNPGDVPLAGDFNGDGCDTLSVYRPSEARFYVINKLGKNGGGLGAADYSFLFGDPGDKPVVGDWDRDGVDEVGLHRESSGFFYYRTTLSTGVAHGQFFFGDPGDRFVAGDWGVIDGADTPGLFRPGNRVFYFRHSLAQGNADSQFTWTGAATGWLPIAGDFGL